MLPIFRRVRRQRGFTTGVGFHVYNFIGYRTGMDRNGAPVSMPESQTSGPRLFPRRGEYDLLFDVDIANLL